jgi:cystatin-C
VKKKLGFLLLTVAITLLLGSITGVHAQQTPMAGGYQSASVTDPDVMAAARYAVKKQKRKRSVRLVSIERAETQVVAGMNYRLCLKVKIKGKTRTVTTVVYKNLQQRYSLTSWKQGKCESAAG